MFHKFLKVEKFFLYVQSNKLLDWILKLLKYFVTKLQITGQITTDNVFLHLFLSMLS